MRDGIKATLSPQLSVAALTWKAIRARRKWRSTGLHSRRGTRSKLSIHGLLLRLLESSRAAGALALLRRHGLAVVVTGSQG